LRATGSGFFAVLTPSGAAVCAIAPGTARRTATSAPAINMRLCIHILTGTCINRDSPDDPRTDVNIRVFRPSCKNRSEVRTVALREILGNGTHATIAEIAIVEFHVGRVMRLTLLAPDIVEAILDGGQPADTTLAALMKPFPVEWGRQRRTFATARP
jgi:hypothetical protein